MTSQPGRVPNRPETAPLLTRLPNSQELVSWLNSLLHLNITKVEQCGTGVGHGPSAPPVLLTLLGLDRMRSHSPLLVNSAALCQVFDSIFLDIPMSRVKFNVNTEYAYIQNFKVLQSKSPLRHPRSASLHGSSHAALSSADAFAKHGVEKPVPVQALIKCKMQDNLEFLQWAKRYWDQHYPGGDYDAVARRKGGAMPASSGPGPRVTNTSAARRGGTTPSGGPRIGVRAPGGGAASAALQQENNTLKETVVGLERERDFYFSKLRDIELLVQQAVEEDPELEKQEDGLIKAIQTILYSTEEGFEIPAEGEEGEGLDDQETF
ncbi:hypothetical protein JX265_008072 [Neoarthrinium moseri]|uniref:EB1 C-terminal domain-containing protein n=1 Tax=Neoarthrinium moseri TaxID=1658444 RepID=A0A9P9WJ29_9PEZI|nr:hypothetical protein JX265_008072 [Neoarthrinium moseri]